MKRYLPIAFLFLLFSCAKQTYVADVRFESYRLDDMHEATNSGVDSLIAPYRAAIEEEMNEVVGYAEGEMVKSKPNSALSNWVADVLLDLGREYSGGQVDFAIQNYGGIRIPSISPGNVSRGKIFELMPFENKLVILQSDGKVVKQFFDRIAQYGGWPLSKGTSFRIQGDRAIDIIIDGKPLNLEGQYTFVLPDFVADGGDDNSFLKDVKRRDMDLLIRDGIFLWLQQNNRYIPFNNEIRIFE